MGLISLLPQAGEGQGVRAVIANKFGQLLS